MKVKWNNQVFLSYTHLAYYLARQDGENMKPSIFPLSDLIYIRYHLQEKFKRKFKIREIKDLIKELNLPMKTAQLPPIIN